MVKLFECEKIKIEDFDDEDDDIPVVDGFESESYERIREKMDIRHQYMLDKKEADLTLVTDNEVQLLLSK